MNNLAHALLGQKISAETSTSSTGSQPGGQLAALGANAPMASAPTTASPARGLGPVAGTPPLPPASPRPPSPMAPAGLMTTPALDSKLLSSKSTPTVSSKSTIQAPKLAADMLREALKQTEMPKGMRPIAPPKPPAPPKPFKPKDPGTTKGFQLGSTAGTI